MTGGSTIIGPWPNKGQTADADTVPITNSDTDHREGERFDAAYLDDEDEIRSHWRRPLAFSLCIVTAIAWVGLICYTQYVAVAAGHFQLSDGVNAIAIASAPLALIGVVWMLMMRTSSREATRFARTVDDLRSEEARLGLILADVAERIANSRAALAQQGDELMSLGDDAAQRLAQISETMRSDVDGIGRHSNALKNSAAAARADMAVLLSDLPKAQVQTRQMVAALQEAGVTAHEKAGALDAQLSALTLRGREADEIAGGAAQKLAAHLTRMEGVSEVAGARLEESANQMTGAVDAALERAADALSTARQGMEAQSAAMLAMVEQSQAAMATAGSDAAESISQRISFISERVEKIAKTFADQDVASKILMERLNQEIDGIEQRFVKLGDDSTVTAERASAAILGLRDNADALADSLAIGGKTAESLIGQAESLLTALDASSREIDETLPAAYARLEQAALQSRATAQAVVPEIAAIEAAATTALGQLREAESLVTAQRTGLDGLINVTSEKLTESRATAQALSDSIDAMESKAKSLTEATGPQLVEALLRVKDTANQAAEHARNALAEIIPQSAAALGAQTRDALTAAMTKQVEEQMGEIARTAETAVEAAQKATDRLMRQMLTISETSAALEARVAEAKEDVERADQSSFSRRVALLIESLNSTAIDVTKILSNDVTDTAWAAYLRGDRGVFTRRAVKLLDTGEVREIARHYDEEPEFRDQVNRYIHDFEAMLRNVLSTRDGGPLSVTLLSSDAGKLYVALAQAIERLRS
jgi:hypothetical protein